MKKVLLFYKFVELEDADFFRVSHQRFCDSLGIKGKVLVAHEGINGSVSGTHEQMEQYKANLRGIEEFKDVVFKEEDCLDDPFDKMIVKVRENVINIGRKVDLGKKGKYISPDELVNLYESGEEFLIVDGRNNYESKIGKFKDAITPDVDTFREFDKVVEMLRGNEDKKIVTYCTGGIRCEKASAMLIENGFNNVYQLEGGVITFCQKHPETFWEGSCFVFDKRLVSKVGQKNSPITRCDGCDCECDFYRNCNNVKCNKLFIICDECVEESKGCCSDSCLEKLKEFYREKEIANRGKITKTL